MGAIPERRLRRRPGLLRRRVGAGLAVVRVRWAGCGPEVCTPVALRVRVLTPPTRTPEPSPRAPTSAAPDPAAPPRPGGAAGAAGPRLLARDGWLVTMRRVGLPVDPVRWAHLLATVPPTLNARRQASIGAYGQPVLDAAQRDPLRRVHVGYRRRESGRWYGNEIATQSITAAMRYAPGPGFVFLDVDFRACHLHIAAQVSGDPQLAADLRAADLHAVVGASIAPGHPHARALGKAVNFIALCGGSASTIQEQAADLGVVITLEQAEALRIAWWARYPQLRAWTRSLKRNSILVRDGTTEGGWSERKIAHLHDGERARRRQRVALQMQSRESAPLAWTLRWLVDSAITQNGWHPEDPLQWPIRPVLPMHDGFLLEVHQDWVQSAERWLTARVPAACEVVGLTPLPLDISVRSTWAK